MKVIKIGLLDRHELFRSSLESLINSFHGMEVGASMSCFDSLLAQMTPGSIDLLIVDVDQLQDDNCTQLKELIHHFPEIKVMVLTSVVSKEQVLKLIECGICGYFSKDVSPEKLESSIRDVLNNQNQFDVKLGPSVREKLMQREVFKHNPYVPMQTEFSARELQILELVCKEKTNSEISEFLNLSVRTIESHRRRMIEKTNSRNMIGVVIYAISQNIPFDLQTDQFQRV